MTKKATGSGAPRRGMAPPPLSNTTRIGQGRSVLPGVDGRSWAARRYKEHVNALTGHLAGDLSVPEDMLIRRAAQLLIVLEEAEASFALGQTFDVTSYATAVGRLQRVLEVVGLKPRARDVTPDLSTYLGTTKRGRKR